MVGAYRWGAGHPSPRRQGEEGGIVKREAALYASKGQVVCPKCDKATRVAHKIEGDKKVRVCKKCGASLDNVSKAKAKTAAKKTAKTATKSKTATKKSAKKTDEESK